MSDEHDRPDGWERVKERASYDKLVKRDAVTVPKQHAGGEPFHRDAVVVFTDNTAGISKGPGARRVYGTHNPERVAHELAAVVDEWIADGMGPYGGQDLNDELDDVVFGTVDPDAELRKANA